MTWSLYIFSVGTQLHFTIPSLQDMMGMALSKIGIYYELDNTQQVVAVKNEGHVYQLQQVLYDVQWLWIPVNHVWPVTHLPHVTEDCTGCTVCLSVSPIIDCIKMISRTTPYLLRRGVPLGVASVILWTSAIFCVGEFVTIIFSIFFILNFAIL